MKKDTIFDSLASGAKTGTGAFIIFSILESASDAINGLFRVMAKPIWDAYDKRTQAPKVSNSKELMATNYPSAEEMFASLSPEDQLRFKLDMQAKAKKQDRIL